MSKLILIFIATMFLSLLYCNDTTNPFLDSSRARATIQTQTFNDRDTVSIFSRETLSVALYLRDLVNKVNIHIDNNRLPLKPDSMIYKENFPTDPLLIPFSFYDTGWKKIEIRSYLTNNSVVTETCSLYARSPLFQAGISALPGDTIVLKTNPVIDADVSYIWKFLDGTLIQGVLPEKKYLLKNELSSSVGELYVTDNTYRSPSVFFTLTSAISKPIKISCINETIIEDSVYTAEKDFNLKVRITGAEQIQSISINELSFDSVKNENDTILLSKLFNRINTLSSPVKVTIVFDDKKWGTDRRVFFIHYTGNDTNAIPVPSIKITCINDSITADSVYTGEKDFNLKVKITGAKLIQSTSINELSFDSVKNVNDTILLSKFFNRIDTLTSPVEAIIVFDDKKLGTFRKVFYIHYIGDDTTGIPVLSIKNPSHANDTAYVINPILYMYGTVLNREKYNNLYIKLSINGINQEYCTILKNKIDWSYQLDLAPGWNSIELNLLKDSTSEIGLLTTEVLHVKLETDLIDIQPPQIHSIKIDSIVLPANKFFTTSDSPATLSLIVSDNDKVNTVTVNGKAAIKSNDGVTYTIGISPAHSVKGTTFQIVAKDSIGNSSYDTITGVYNHVPKFVSVSIPKNIQPDSTFRFIVKAVDSDNDSLITTATIKRNSDASDRVLYSVIDTFSWKPTEKDTGIYTVTIRVQDELYASVDTTFTVNVSQHVNNSKPVAWVTSENDFPDSIMVNGEPFSIFLETDSLTGTRPFSYTVKLNNPPTVIYEDTSAYFSWLPLREAAWSHSLSFIVNDQNGFSDTLDITLNVIAYPETTVSIVEQMITVRENGETDSATFKLSAPVADTVQIPYFIKFLSATYADIAFDSIGTITFLPGDTLVKLPILLNDDTLYEINELFTINLGTPSLLLNMVNISVDTSKAVLNVTITSDDAVTTRYSFIDSGKSMDEKNPEFAVVVTIDTPLDKVLELTYSFDAESSTGDEDDFTFLSDNHTLTFEPGETSAVFSFSITDDIIPEDDEVLIFNVHSTDPRALPGVYTIYKYTIIDDDTVSKPSVEVMLKPDHEITLPEGANMGKYPAIVLSKALPDDLTVTLRTTANSTAKSGSDYKIDNSSYVIKAGETFKSLGFKTIDDKIAEKTKIFEIEIIKISDTVNAFISDLKVSRVSITDND